MKKSAAFLKIDQARDEWHKREGVLKAQALDLSSTCYFGTTEDGAPFLTAFRGRSQKPSVNYRYRTVKARNDRMREFMEAYAERAEGRKPGERALSVGDVLVSSWGYDQTNVDYYLVIELVGKASVKIVEIGKDKSHSEYMQGKCIPDVTNLIGGAFTKKANGDGVKISSCQYARLKKPEIINGAKIYRADHWTAYA